MNPIYFIFILYFFSPIFIVLVVYMIIQGIKSYKTKLYDDLEKDVLDYLNISNWSFFTNMSTIPSNLEEIKNSLEYECIDDYVMLKSSNAVSTYDYKSYIKEHKDSLQKIKDKIVAKKEFKNILEKFLDNNIFMNRKMYVKLSYTLNQHLKALSTYNLAILYISPAQRSSNIKIIRVTLKTINMYIEDPTAIMTKTEKLKYEKEQKINQLTEKQELYNNRISSIGEMINELRDTLIDTKDEDILFNYWNRLCGYQLTISKIKLINSLEWINIENDLNTINNNVINIRNKNNSLLNYYKSDDFIKLKSIYKSLTKNQIEFNEYIKEKTKHIIDLFGKSNDRNETQYNDNYNYIRPYKKSIDYFTVNVSPSIFASAENDPITYIIKYFYSNKDDYLKYIQNLKHLIEEIETLKEAKIIIDNYNKQYKDSFKNVPDYVLTYDKDGFYERLGFANLSEDKLLIEYKFSYISDGGYAQREFTIPMTEENIIKIINKLQNKIDNNSFSKEQRQLMTSTLRKKIKERDNYTCCHCGNSIWKEPNLLLEIDHIVPIANGGCTVENNLQTLCWVCNRHKGTKNNNNIIDINASRSSIQTQIIQERSKF